MLLIITFNETIKIESRKLMENVQYTKLLLNKTYFIGP